MWMKLWILWESGVFRRESIHRRGVGGGSHSRRRSPFSQWRTVCLITHPGSPFRFTWPTQTGDFLMSLEIGPTETPRTRTRAFTRL